ncbi:MAG: DUF493 domain-containing protein [bacterium]
MCDNSDAVKGGCQPAVTGGCQWKVELDYPCPWSYKIIGADESQLRALIAGLVGDRAHTASLSNRSRSGKYTSLTLSLTVTDEADRLALFESLSRHPAVKFVL